MLIHSHCEILIQEVTLGDAESLALNLSIIANIVTSSRWNADSSCRGSSGPLYATLFYKATLVAQALPDLNPPSFSMSRLVPALLVYYIRATAQAWVAHQRVTRPPQRKQQLDQFSFSHLNPHINPLYAGAIYLWARLPKHAQDDTRAVEWLVKKHGVCVIPGSSCGAPATIELVCASCKLSMSSSVIQAPANGPYMRVCIGSGLRNGFAELVLLYAAAGHPAAASRVSSLKMLSSKCKIRPGAGTFQHTEAETVNEETEEKGYLHRMQNQCSTTGAHKERGAWATWDLQIYRFTGETFSQTVRLIGL
eukprot:1159608-Pelagomonas_calceolata.AAC.8